MIIGIDLLQLRNSEFLQFLSDYAKIVDVNDPATLNVVAQQAAFKTKIAEAEPLFCLPQSSPLTPQLRLINRQRKSAIDGIKLVIKGYRYHFDDATAKSAKRLTSHLKIPGKNITRQNTPTLSTLIETITTDWETNPELSAALATLGLTAWAAELKTANNLFTQKYIERTLEYGAASSDTMKGKREEAVAAYYELRKFINANAVLHPNHCAKAINELNAHIDQYNVLINERRMVHRKQRRNKKNVPPSSDLQDQISIG